jgi:hypothetical protein
MPEEKRLIAKERNPRPQAAKFRQYYCEKILNSQSTLWIQLPALQDSVPGSDTGVA